MKGLFIKVSGGCMRPLIKDGSIIEVLPLKKVYCGDIVLYRTEYGNFLHRIIKFSSEKILVCDDIGITYPTEVSFNQIIGVYPTVFNGTLGILYHYFVRTVFIYGRSIKNFLKSILKK